MNHPAYQLFTFTYVCFLACWLNVIVEYVSGPVLPDSMKRDCKSVNVNSEIVKYVIDDCLMNIFLKKSRPKTAKMAELGYFELDCKKLYFEKNNFEIYESDFWEKVNFETFHVQIHSQKVCSRSILNFPIRF